MEKIFAFIQWWTNLNNTKKTLSFLLGAAIWTVIMAVTLGGTFHSKENLPLKETLLMAKDCDQRLLEVRKRCDSIASIKENKFDEERKIFYQRTPKIEDRNNAIKNALK